LKNEKKKPKRNNLEISENPINKKWFFSSVPVVVDEQP